MLLVVGLGGHFQILGVSMKNKQKPTWVSKSQEILFKSKATVEVKKGYTARADSGLMSEGTQGLKLLFGIFILWDSGKGGIWFLGL